MLKEDQLRLLVLDGSEADVERLTQEFDRTGAKPVTRRVDAEHEFTAALKEFAPHAVIADHSNDTFSTADALRTVQRVRPAVPFIVLAHAIDESSAVATVRAGADDIVLKSNLKRIPTAVQAAMDTRRGLERLSNRQLEVLKLVAEGHTTREIAQQLSLSAKTVDTHRGEAMKRLGIHDVTALVRYAIRVGIVSSEA
jgi:DNA-binding NarL/FixJ family response regulator